MADRSTLKAISPRQNICLHGGVKKPSGAFLPLKPLLATVIVCLCLQGSAQQVQTIGKADSVTAVASLHYQPHSFLRRIFMGSNYRDVWEMPVTVPVFHFSSFSYTIQDLGGGKQTKSLYLLDSAGRRWSLRTVDKTIEKEALAPALRNRFGQNLSQDLISAAFPYAAPLVGELAFAAGVNAARVPLFYVADDAALGEYRDVFAGELCTLEERDAGFDSTFTSQEMETMLQSGRYAMEQTVYLKARLFDMLIGDWDRHEGNWQWGQKDSAGTLWFCAVPRDRDWAFYRSGGLLPWLGRTTGSLPYLVPFSHKIKNVKGLGIKSREMDRRFLNGLNATEWETAIRDMQAKLTDERIVQALQILPTAVYSAKADWFAKRLRSRRDDLMNAALKYRRYLMKAGMTKEWDKMEANGSGSGEKNVSE